MIHPGKAWRVAMRKQMPYFGNDLHHWFHTKRKAQRHIARQVNGLGLWANREDWQPLCLLRRPHDLLDSRSHEPDLGLCHRWIQWE